MAWGRIASALVDASGQVPITLAVIGPCAAGPALLNLAGLLGATWAKPGMTEPSSRGEAGQSPG